MPAPTSETLASVTGDPFAAAISVLLVSRFGSASTPSWFLLRVVYSLPKVYRSPVTAQKGGNAGDRVPQ